MDCGTQNIIRNLFHAQLKCTYAHAKRKIKFSKLCDRPQNHEIVLLTDEQNIQEVTVSNSL